MKRRYAIAGVGVRSLCFAKSLLNDYRDCSEVAAIFDTNQLRMKGFNELLKADIPCFTDFSEMVEAVRPTHLIIGTPDYTHDELVELAFANNLDVICEKPMATTAGKVRHILDLEKRYGRKIIVTFNYRYIPYVSKIKEIIQSGIIGKVLSVTLDWHLDRAHGPEYFRRWHANMEKSGGLFVHKATHHFDLVNWFLDDDPIEVAAFGTLNIFGANNAFRGERCSTCPHAGGKCLFEMKLHKVPSDKDIFDKLYWDAENADGYIRDRCLFSDDIDIYDTMNAIVKYKGGAHLSYSLTAYAPYEGYEIAITCENGRLEASETHAGIFMHSHDDRNIIKIFTGTDRSNQVRNDIAVDVDKSEHGGGDTRMYRRIFKADLPDPLKQSAGSHAGAMSCLTGIAANISVKEKRIISINSLDSRVILS